MNISNRLRPGPQQGSHGALYGVVVLGLAACRQRPTTAFVGLTGGIRQVESESRQAADGLPTLGVRYFYFVEPGTNNSLRKAVASGA